MRHAFPIGLLLAGLTAAVHLPLTRAAEPLRPVDTTTSRPARPVLIRNDQNPLLRIDIEVRGDEPIELRSLTFDLDGTDDVGDIVELALFSTGGQAEFSAAAPLGKLTSPRTAHDPVRIDVSQSLAPGRHHFWLACRIDGGADLSHRVAARGLSFETSAGEFTPRDASPGRRQRIGVALRRHNDDGVHTYRIPALTASARGTLLCVYDMRRRGRRDLQEDIDIGLSRSEDGGRTWQPPRVIMDMGEYGDLPQEQNGCSDPGIIVDHETGEIFCFAVWMNGKPGKHQWSGDGSEPGFEIGKSAQLMVVRSTDDGLTWSKPENLTRQLKREAWWLLAPSPQSGIQLPDGTLVMPAEGRDEEGRKFPTLLVSRDHGRSWQVGEPAYKGGNECQAAFLGDGSIMLNCRNDLERFRGVFTTRDLGKTWTPHPTHRNTLIEPNCNGSLLRFDFTQEGERRHALLFANPQSQTARTHHTIQVSFDDGASWPESHRWLLDEGRGAGYPSMTRVDDSHVGIVYEGSGSDLVFEKLSLGELLAGEPRLPRDNLMVYRGADNGSQPVRTKSDWLRRREEIVRGMETVMGPLPGIERRSPLDMEIEEEVDCGSYVRRLVTYGSEPGSRVPAYLCIPKDAISGERPAPAVLCLHGTDNTVGHGVVVGLGGRANRQYASELAERGYVTLAPNYPLLAKYQPDVHELGWRSGTLKAVWDNIRGLDLLESLPCVKPGGFGAIGHSLGGHNAVYTSVFDSRIKAVASSCGLDSYLDYMDGDEKVWQPEKGWCQTRYMLRLADYRGRLEAIPFDFHEMVGALAPRHVLIVAPQHDHNFRADSVDRIAAAAAEIYKLYGEPDRLQVLHPDCDHDFPPEMREAAYKLFDDILAK